MIADMLRAIFVHVSGFDLYRNVVLVCKRWNQGVISSMPNKLAYFEMLRSGSIRACSPMSAILGLVNESEQMRRFVYIITRHGCQSDLDDILIHKNHSRVESATPSFHNVCEYLSNLYCPLDLEDVSAVLDKDSSDILNTVCRRVGQSSFKGWIVIMWALTLQVSLHRVFVLQ